MSDTPNSEVPEWLVPFDAPQAPNASALRTEAIPSGTTVTSIDTDLGISAPQAPGPEIDLTSP